MAAEILKCWIKLLQLFTLVSIVAHGLWLLKYCMQLEKPKTNLKFCSKTHWHIVVVLPRTFENYCNDVVIALVVWNDRCFTTACMYLTANQTGLYQLGSIQYEERAHITAKTPNKMHTWLQPWHFAFCPTILSVTLLFCLVFQVSSIWINCRRNFFRHVCHVSVLILQIFQLEIINIFKFLQWTNVLTIIPGLWCS